VKINIGPGPHPAAGWINVDVQEQWEPDVLASCEDLPFKDGVASHVYCGHVLEHMDLDAQIYRCLAEIRRVLRPDGELMVVGPDLDRAKQGWPDMIEAIWPGMKHPGSVGAEHLWPSTVPTTMSVLGAAGYDAQEIPIAQVPKPWPVTAYVGWQLAILARP
jgi:predicted SAM-dependent methyltransferase